MNKNTQEVEHAEPFFSKKILSTSLKLWVLSVM